MEAKLFKFPITDFEEVYVITDSINNRLHITAVNYSFNITLDLTKDLNEEVYRKTKWLENSISEKVCKVVEKINEELNV